MFLHNPRFSFLLILVASLTGGALAQPPNKPNASTATPIARLELPPDQTPYAPPSSRQSPATENSAAASFDHVVELTGQLDQRLLTTVYWCLGTLVGVFLLLIGFNWFTNFRLNQREISTLRAELTSQVTSARTNLEQANAAMQEKLRTEIRSAAKAAAEAALQPLRTRIDRTQDSVQELTAKFVAMEVDDWVKKKVYINAINNQIEYLGLIRQTDHLGYFFNHGLDKLQRIFHEAIDEEHPSRPEALDIAGVTRFFDKIEKENPVMVARLRDLLAELIKKGR
jgi:hypothetical protein